MGPDGSGERGGESLARFCMQQPCRRPCGMTPQTGLFNREKPGLKRRCDGIQVLRHTSHSLWVQIGQSRRKFSLASKALQVGCCSHVCHTRQNSQNGVNGLHLYQNVRARLIR